MIRVPYAHLHVAAATHPGMGGRQNEDRFAISSYKLGINNDIASVFAIVSDGIGGHRAGEVAAEMAVETISHMVAQSDGRAPLDVLDHAIQVTSDAIAARAKDDSQRLGMGTTCACAWVLGSQLYIASVGDSRVYLLRNGSLMQLTTDHTWVQEAVEKGILAPQDASRHPNVHVIRRYLGSSKTPQADVRLRLAKEETDTQARSNQGLRLHSGDMLLLCTDGLTDVIPDEDIEPTVRGLDIQPAVEKLVKLACEREGKDNITVVMMLVPWGAVPEQKSSKFWKWALIALVGLLLAGLLLVLASWAVATFVLPPSFTPTPAL
jgi:serine/threonine protein phosphatase PrpC